MRIERQWNFKFSTKDFFYQMRNSSRKIPQTQIPMNEKKTQMWVKPSISIYIKRKIRIIDEE